MGLMSFTQEGRFRQWLDKKQEEGAIPLDGPIRNDYDYQVSFVLSYMRDMGIRQLKTGMNDLLSQGAELAPYSHLAGVLAQKLRNTPATLVGDTLITGDILAQQYGLPSFKLLDSLGGSDDWALALQGDTDAIGALWERLKLGAKKEGKQFAYGISEQVTAEDTYLSREQFDPAYAEIKQKRQAKQKGRKADVAAIKELESIWAYYNATPDSDNSSGYDTAYNIVGTAGEASVGIALGVSTTAFSRGRYQPVFGVAANTALEMAKYKEHGDKVEAGSGIALGALEFLPNPQTLIKAIPIIGNSLSAYVPNLGKRLAGLSPVKKGQQLGNRIIYGLEGGSKEISTISRELADRKGNAFRLMGGGTDAKSAATNAINPLGEGNLDRLMMPFSWLKEGGKQLSDRVSKETHQTPLVQISESLNNLYASGNSLFTKALNNIGPTKGELAKHYKLGTIEQFPMGQQIKQTVIAAKQRFNEAAAPFRAAYLKAGENYKLDADLLRSSANDILTDTSGSKELKKVIKGVLDRDTLYNPKELSALKEFANTKSILNGQIAQAEKASAATSRKMVDLNTQALLLRGQIQDLPADSAAHKVAVQKLSGTMSQIGEAAKANKAAYESIKTSRGGIVDAEVGMETIKSEGGMIDFEALSANQAEQVLRTLNEKIYEYGSTLEGLSNSGKQQLKKWSKGVRSQLRGLPEDFSVPYSKAKDLDQAKLNLFHGGTNESISGLNKALTDETGEAVEKLFLGENGLLNLSKLGEFANDEYLRRGVTRLNLESKIGAGKDYNNYGAGESFFNFKKFAEDFSAVDFDQYRKLFPNADSSGIDTLSGLSGVDSLNASGWLNDIGRALGDKGDLFQYETSALKDITDLFFLHPKNKPYANYTGQGPSLIDYVAGEVRKTQPSKVTPAIKHAPMKEAAIYNKRLMKSRIENGGDAILSPYNIDGQGLDILDNPLYHSDFPAYELGQ